MTTPDRPDVTALRYAEWHAAMRQMLHFAHWPTPAPNIPGCDCRVPDEEWDDVDENAPLALCAIHEKRWGAISRDTAITVLLDYEAATHQAMELSKALWLGCDCTTAPAEMERDCCCEDGTACYITQPAVRADATRAADAEVAGLRAAVADALLHEGCYPCAGMSDALERLAALAAQPAAPEAEPERCAYILPSFTDPCRRPRESAVHDAVYGSRSHHPFTPTPR